MKFKVLSLVLWFLLAISPWVSGSAAGCDLTVRTFEFPPFASKDEHGHWSGVDMDYTKVLLDEADCKYRFVEVPWGRSLEMLKEGKIDMMLSVTKTPERAGYTEFIGPQRMEVLRFVSKKGKIASVTHWDQLAALKIPLIRQRGTFIGDRFEQMLVDNPRIKKRLLYIPNTTVRMELILKDRAIGFFAEQSYLNYEFDKNPDFTLLELHPLIINAAPVHYAFSKASVSKTQIAQLKAAYQRLYQQQKIQAIEGHYDMY